MPRLRAHTWVTIGSCFGLGQQLLHLVVDADVECTWRERVGWLTTSSGTFRQRHSFRLFNQTAQIRCPVETTYELSPDAAVMEKAHLAPASDLGSRRAPWAH